MLIESDLVTYGPHESDNRKRMRCQGKDYSDYGVIFTAAVLW